MAVDPVCGMEIDESLAEDLGAERLEHEGQVFWFCCPHCRRQFQADPQRYLGSAGDGFRHDH
ncbi:MAG TPA: YHS domain-containing protein [Bacillota bacterium]